MAGGRHRGGRLTRLWFLFVVCAGFVIAAATVAPAALAWTEYLHGGLTDCGACHQDEHMDRPPTTEDCTGCHTGFANPSATSRCYTCHAPAQDTSPMRVESACTTPCHVLAIDAQGESYATTVTHVAHPDRPTACLTCHPLSLSISDPGQSPHHLAPPPPVPTVATFAPVSGDVGGAVTVKGTGYLRATGVTFNGVAAAFEIVSATELRTTVPAGATSGPIAVSSAGGTGASALDFTIVTPPPPSPPAVAGFVPALGMPGSTVVVSGTGFSGTTSVSFGGTAAAFTVVSDTEVAAVVPAGAATGPITVTTTVGSSTSATSFVVVTPFVAKLTLKVDPAIVTLGRRVKAAGVLSPASLAGETVRVTVQRKVAGTWLRVATGHPSTDATGAYVWRYRPLKKGSYRLRASIGQDTTHTAAVTAWVAFKVS